MGMLENTCYIIGAGPSLSKLTIEDLRIIEKGYIVSCNYNYRILPKIDTLCILDGAKFKKIFKKEGKGEDWPEFEKNLGCDIISPHYEDTLKKKHKLSIEKGEGFSLENVHMSTNCGYFAINFALHLRFVKFVLIGIDCGGENWVINDIHNKVDGQEPLKEKLNRDYEPYKKRIVNLRGNLDLIFPYKQTLKEALSQPVPSLRAKL